MTIAICTQQHDEALLESLKSKKLYRIQDLNQITELIEKGQIDLVILDRKLSYFKQARFICNKQQVDYVVYKNNLDSVVNLLKEKRSKKRWARHLIFNENGSVSIYLTIVVISLFLFNAVLIDYARILVAERQTETAAKAAVRSTMASFDPSVHEYGLFGLNDSNPTNTFQDVFSKNLSINQGSYFQFVDTKMVKSQTKVTIDPNRMLSNPTVFKHQIVDDMKYQAPIQFTSAVIDGLMKVSDSMEQASAFADLASDIDKKAKIRKRELDQAKADLSNAKKTLEKMQDQIRKESVKDFPSVTIMEDIVDNLETYQSVVSKKNDSTNAQYSEADARRFARDSKRQMKDIVDKSNSVKTNLINALTELDKARQENKLIQEAIAKKRSQKKNDYATTSSYEKKYGKKTDSLDGVKKNIEKANKKLNDYVMDDGYFTNSEKKIKWALKEVGKSFIVKLNDFQAIVSYQLDSYDRHALDKLQIGIESRHKTSLKDVNQAFDYFIKNRKTYENSGTKEKKSDADKNLQDNKKQLDDLMNQAKSVAGETQFYNTLRELVDKYNGAASSSSKEADMTDPTQTSKDSMALIDQLFHQLGTVLKSERNQIYINEYILSRFKSHDFSIKGADAYKFDNNQVEYIIYGLTPAGADYAAALGEIFTIRFAINFLAAFTDPKIDATGPLAFWTALASALSLTLRNMELLTNGKSIYFFGTIHYMTNYRDLLRLILFLHMRGDQIQRMMAIISLKTSKDLTLSPTYITGNTTTFIKLWFLPNVFRILSKTNIIDGNVKGNKFYISKKADFSY